MNNAKRIGSLAFAIIFFVLEFNLVGIVILVGLIIEWVNEIANTPKLTGPSEELDD